MSSGVARRFRAALASSSGQAVTPRMAIPRPRNSHDPAARMRSRHKNFAAGEWVLDLTSIRRSNPMILVFPLERASQPSLCADSSD